MRTGRGRKATAAAALALAALAGACGDDDEADEPETIVHVALGDSFSSGEGAPPYDASPESCRRATEAWPRRLDTELAERGSVEIESVDLRACAGAQTQHLTDRWTSRNLDAQIPAAPDTDVTLVTVTIGGNDIGFGDIVLSCVLLTCSPEPDSDELQARLDALQTALLEEVHPALASAYPNARIVQVGYPRLVPPPTVDPEGCPWLSGEDQVLANGIVGALDDAIEAAAEQSGIAEYLDVRDAFSGHELCTEDPWVNAIGVGPGGAHPNDRGQRALAEAVADSLDPP